MGEITWRTVARLRELDARLLAEHEADGMDADVLLFIARDMASLNASWQWAI
jgi:hypothetical protein